MRGTKTHLRTVIKTLASEGLVVFSQVFGQWATSGGQGIDLLGNFGRFDQWGGVMRFDPGVQDKWAGA